MPRYAILFLVVEAEINWLAFFQDKLPHLLP